MQLPTSIVPGIVRDGKCGACQASSDALCGLVGFDRLNASPAVAGNLPGIGPAVLYAQDCSASFFVLQEVSWERAAAIMAAAEGEPGALLNDVDLVIVIRFLDEGRLWQRLNNGDVPAGGLWRLYCAWQATVPGRPGPTTRRRFARAMADLGYTCRLTPFGPAFAVFA